MHVKVKYEGCEKPTALILENHERTCFQLDAAGFDGFLGPNSFHDDRAEVTGCMCSLLSFQGA